MQIEAAAIDTLFPDPANVRKHSNRNLDSIKASLLTFGQQKPIVVNEDGVVIAGNGTFFSAKELGWQHINIVRTSLKGAEATAFAIADNRTSELAQWDESALSEVLTALAIQDEDLAQATGFTGDELKELVDSTTGIGPPGEFKELGEDIETEYCCPKCSYEWSGSPK
tara:strand:+ start:9178 stop:9681 length:504 start_codon:yes stop_codon:yes gene_type:complete